MTGSADQWDGHAQAVLRLFDEKASAWSAKYAPDGALVGRLASLSDAVRRYVQAGDRVLDLGCGTGELTRALAQGGVRATGADISSEMLRRATQEPGSHADWVQLEPGWHALPFGSGSFDAVVAASVLEYVTAPAAVLAECARVARPGGVVLYTVPDLRHPVRWAEWPAQRLARGKPSGDGGRSPWQSYRAYLSASRQRHRLRWWLATSAAVGLCPVRCLGSAGRSTLRLLVFRSAAQPVAEIGAAERADHEGGRGGPQPVV
jgi:SAM-dependent methyltransferase